MKTLVIILIVIIIALSASLYKAINNVAFFDETYDFVWLTFPDSQIYYSEKQDNLFWQEYLIVDSAKITKILVSKNKGIKEYKYYKCY